MSAVYTMPEDMPEIGDYIAVDTHTVLLVVMVGEDEVIAVNHYNLALVKYCGDWQYATDSQQTQFMEDADDYAPKLDLSS